MNAHDAVAAPASRTASRTALPPAAELTRAYLRSDPAYDGLFLLGVRTTGIFCRPTCPARKPQPRNVVFFPGPREAMFAGFRPCKRCRPLAASDEPAWVPELLAAVERAPGGRLPDKELRAMGLDPSTARRHFLRRYGMTFQAYVRARRLGTALSLLREGARTGAAARAGGYGSPSGFREAFARLFGDAPARARTRPASASDGVRVRWLETPLGPMIAGATAAGVCLLEFTDRRMLETQFHTLRRRFRGPVFPGNSPHLDRLARELDAYFAGRRRRFTVPLDVPGSPFQTRVWRALLEIPYGGTCSYVDLARAIGSPRASRAVGRANGQNRIAIVIPCHRVVNADGRLGSYGGGLRRKEALLGLERGGHVSGR
jgi:AraC family transcriptional regulator of adaptative response/methylated-DNA-[protein]-cysteine methyltransferase